MMKILILLIITTLISGCMTTAHVIPDADLSKSNIPTRYSVKDKYIDVYKPIDNKNEINFVVLKTDTNVNIEQYHIFMKAMLNSIGFKDVLNEAQFAQRIIENEIEGVSGSISDLVSLHRIYKSNMRFLTISSSLSHEGGARWEQKLEIIDPSVPEPVLKVQISKVNWADVDTEFNYPMVNLISEWYKKSK